jgi:hypothetical protein
VAALFKIEHPANSNAKRHQAYSLDGRDDDFTVFTCSTIIGAEIEPRFLWLDPGQYQPSPALGTGRPEIIDKFESQRVCHGETTQRCCSSDSESIPCGETAHRFSEPATHGI